MQTVTLHSISTYTVDGTTYRSGDEVAVTPEQAEYLGTTGMFFVSGVEELACEVKTKKGGVVIQQAPAPVKADPNEPVVSI